MGISIIQGVYSSSTPTDILFHTLDIFDTRDRKMRLTDFTIRKHRACMFYESALLRFALLSDGNDIFLLHGTRQMQLLSKDVCRLCERYLTISSTTFNLNILSEEQSLSLFRFRKAEIRIIADFMRCKAYRTEQNRYRLYLITAVCIVLWRPSSPSRWRGVKCMFWMYGSAMSEVFWEVIEKLVETRSGLFETFRSNLIAEPAPLYAASIHQKGAPLNNCVGFMDCTKIQNTTPCGSAVNLRVFYSGHKRFHCLIYQTVTKPYGLLFYMYGPEVG